MDLERNPTLSYVWNRRKCHHCNKLLDQVKIEYEDIITIKAYNHKRYCNHKCLKADLRSLGFDGAVHAVHQKFGPDHPVTKQIQMMRKALKDLRRGSCPEYELYRQDCQSRNFYKNLRESEKCL